MSDAEKWAKNVEEARKKGVKIGKNTNLVDMPHFSTEPYLIEIGENVTISVEVMFLTHDGARWACSPYINENISMKIGNIKISDGCFIGARTILLPGVKIGKNSITGAGSVVTKNIPDGEVWAGNPAKFICKTVDYAKKLEKLNNSEEFLKLCKFVSVQSNNKSA